MTNRLVSKGGDPPIKATVGKTEDAYAQMLPADPDTPAADHAFVGVIDKYRATGIHRQVTQNFSEALRLELNPKVSRYFLQLARAALETMGTVYVIARQKQLKGGARQP